MRPIVMFLENLKFWGPMPLSITSNNTKHITKIITSYNKNINLNKKKKFKNKKIKAFLKHKNKHVLIRKCNSTLNKKTLSSPIFCPI
jgi:hypothetical protein